jgi:lysophospholipase L1-like esterase
VLLGSDLLERSRPIELGADAARIDPHHPEIVSLGRVDRSDDSRLVFDWPGVAIRARVLAPTAHFLLSSEEGSQYFDVRVDGERRFVARISPDARPIDLSNLGPGAHDLEIQKRDGPSSPVSFLGLELPPGGLILPPAARPRRQIEVLGASVASGHGNEGNAYGWQNSGSKLRYCPNTRRYTNAGASFGFVLGDWYDAEVHLIAEGGRGIIRSYGETQPRSDRTLPLIATRTLATRPGIWDDTGWRPEVVIINLGENDVSKEAGFEPEIFRDEYVGFLENLRARREEAFFVLLNEKEREGLCRIVSEVIAVRRAAGDEHIAAICYREPALRNRGCDTHPNSAAHVDVARIIAEVIEPVLGWRRPDEPL